LAICATPNPDEAMNNIVSPRKASSDTRRSGMPGADEGVLMDPKIEDR
jgi:hypothetical protein